MPNKPVFKQAVDKTDISQKDTEKFPIGTWKHVQHHSSWENWKSHNKISPHLCEKTIIKTAKDKRCWQRKKRALANCWNIKWV